MAENWIQSMNRCTGPAPCQCPITGPHQPTNPHCSRNAPLNTDHIRSVPGGAAFLRIAAAGVSGPAGQTFGEQTPMGESKPK